MALPKAPDACRQSGQVCLGDLWKECFDPSYGLLVRIGTFGKFPLKSCPVRVE